MFRIVNTAQRSPGKCAISGDSSGPFIDTGKDVKRYGRIYLSIKFFDEPLRELGYIGPEETSRLSSEIKSALTENVELQGFKEKYEELIEAMLPYVPVPAPKTVEVKKVVPRDPSDTEVEEWIKKHGNNHPAIKAAIGMEKGSTEEWFSLYRDKHDKPEKLVTTKEQQALNTEKAQEEQVPGNDEGGPDKFFTLMDQEVDLDKLLKEPAKTVVSVAEGKPDEFVEALVRREWYIAETKKKSPRKSVLLPLDYWDEEDDVPLYPSDEEEEVLNLNEGAA